MCFLDSLQQPNSVIPGAEDLCINYLADAYNGNSIMASIALAQLKHLDEENSIRRMIAEKYDNSKSGVDFFRASSYHENRLVRRSPHGSLSGDCFHAVT